MRAVTYNHNIAIQIITAAPDVFAQRHTRLNAQAVALDRDKGLAPGVSIVRDQIVQIIRGQFDAGRLVATVFKIFPFQFCRADIFIGGFELRHRRRFLREHVHFFRPIKTVQHGGMRSHPKIQTDRAGDD